LNVPLATDSQGRNASRKKCPQCNAIYDDELIAYCAFHVVPLVDINTPPPPDAIEEESRRNVLLWLLVVITFLAATMIGLILFMPRGGQNLAAVAPASTPTPVPVWKGTPDADGSLKSKIADLPAAQTALKIVKPETVVVRVRIGNDGRVLSVQSSSANEELRRAAMDAARKATFLPDKLRARETVGTITYKFNP
jgi:TonB family protein